MLTAKQVSSSRTVSLHPLLSMWAAESPAPSPETPAVTSATPSVFSGFFSTVWKGVTRLHLVIGFVLIALVILAFLEA